MREDYSPDGSAWEYLPHDHARSRAYRWGEDGIAGISDNHQRLCFAWAFWNGRDPILKERLFGLSGPQGNHGEDVKECYFYLDSTPTHSYMKYLYKYPQAAFPYEDLVEENRRRGRGAPEYELLDTGVFDEDRYWDILIEYAKAGVNDILIRVTATNRGPEAAVLDLLPTLWFRNTWAWDRGAPRPTLSAWERAAVIEADHDALGMRWLVAEGSPELLFTDNDTNFERLWGAPNGSPYVKDGIDDHVVRGVPGRVNPARTGTKAALHYRVTLGPGESNVIKLRLANAPPLGNQLGGDFDALFARRLSRGRRVLRDGRSRLPARRRQARDAPGARRSPLDQAVLPLRRPAMARGRSRAAAAAPRAPARPQPRVDAPLQQRRHLDAGQVGIPVVRGLGPRLPLPAARPRRPGLRQGAARPAPARVVHAPERPAPGLRVVASATSTRRCTPGPPGACTRSTSACAGRRTGPSSSACSTSSS